MPRLHAEALIFCLAWAALALFGGQRGGWFVGAALSAGLLVILMPATALILSRTGDFALERRARWGILIAAALALTIWLTVRS